MNNIVIVYHSGYGHTARMAQAVAQGANAALIGIDADGNLPDGAWAQLAGAEAIIFGSPTYMGGISAQLKSMMDATSPRYLQRKWVDKIGAAFTVSASPSGDKLNMLVGCATFAMQHGMIWVGVAESPVTGEGYNRLGFFLGAAGQALFEPPSEKPSAEDKLTGEMLGRRVAKLTLNLLRGKLEQ